MSMDFCPGQRWISDAEPELGLGSIVRVDGRTVTALFRASGEKRVYARNNAPLRRVRFHPGDVVRNRSDRPFAVESVTERDGILQYRSGAETLPEADLSDTICFDKPEDRLLAGQIDPPQLFRLRLEALTHQHRIRQSPVRGFIGGRIDLIRHQLYIASEVSSRLAPRVLLADEVGLGKTIEACLTLHRLILTGRAERVLIIVPDSLVNQWFIELLRRFNLWFRIFDEERCASIESAAPGANPFLDDQLIVCSIHLFTGSELRVEQALEARWDILIVDEAHHLRWSPESASLEYRIVEKLGARTPGLLLLTATPEQLGVTSHFARLRLLDPGRFHDLSAFMRESAEYRDVALRADALLHKGSLNALETRQLDTLLDRHGTGRVSFRNTRGAIQGFPARHARLWPLSSAQERANWLASLLRALDPEKVLLICRSPEQVAAIETALRQRLQIPIGVFHEGLSLIQRDRSAAWFADDDGARILICSEIGSEGRNFQFAHHLVLFDLPLDPELLEQRIGRLDRIGQTSSIEIHVPFVAGGSGEVVARWYHEGLNAFEKNLAGGHELFERFGPRVQDLAARFDFAAASALAALIEETRAAAAAVAEKLRTGRDRLLELNSFKPAAAENLVEAIRREDNDTSLDGFMMSVFDEYAIPVEELSYRTYRLGSAGVLADRFPGLPSDGFSVTCDRSRALVRENIQFLTWDHPLVTGALDLLLGSEKGISSFAFWPDSTVTALYLEAVYVLECVAPPRIHADRFLPPTPLRVMVDHSGRDAGLEADFERLEELLKPADPPDLLERAEFREQHLPLLLGKTRDLAAAREAPIIEQARRRVSEQLTREWERLRDLKRVNRSVRDEEIELLAAQQNELDRFLAASRLRLDSLRLLWRGPAA